MVKELIIETITEKMKGGLGKWFNQKWVDVSRKSKSGSHPKCGASADSKSRAGGKRAYPKCVPAGKAASMSKKDKESATRRKRAAYKGKGAPSKKPKLVKTKTENTNDFQLDQAFLDAKPVKERLKKGEYGCCHHCGHSHRKGSAHVTPYRTGKNSCANRKSEIKMTEDEQLAEITRLMEKSVPNDPKKWAASKAAAKRKFDVYPSAYANAWAAKNYKSKGGTWRKGK